MQGAVAVDWPIVDAFTHMRRRRREQADHADEESIGFPGRQVSCLPRREAVSTSLPDGVAASEKLLEIPQSFDSCVVDSAHLCNLNQRGRITHFEQSCTNFELWIHNANSCVLTGGAIIYSVTKVIDFSEHRSFEFGLWVRRASVR